MMRRIAVSVLLEMRRRQLLLPGAFARSRACCGAAASAMCRARRQAAKRQSGWQCAASFGGTQRIEECDGAVSCTQLALNELLGACPIAVAYWDR